jgi:hypothetical protein
MQQGPYSGRWEAIATVSAGSRRWAYEVRMRWWRNRWIQEHLPRTANFKARKLIKLTMIGFARWSIFDRVPTGEERSKTRRLTRPFVLFESNFNGGADEYFEAFSYIVPEPMNRVWANYGVPDVRRVSEFVAYINRNKEPIAYCYAAYPKATTKRIRAALRLDQILNGFNHEVPNMSSAKFETKLRQVAVRAHAIRNPRRFSKPAGKTPKLATLVPVLPFRRPQLEEDLEVLVDAPVPARTHFARWCIVDRLKTPSRFGSDPTSYLLFSAWFDDPQTTYVQDLYNELGEARVERIWRNCGFDGSMSLEAFLNPHRVEAGSAFAAYDGVSVEAVRTALKRWQRFHDFAAGSQDRGPQDVPLKEAWMKDSVLKPPEP